MTHRAVDLPQTFDLTQGFRVEHRLTDHPLLSPAAIRALADRLPPGSAELSLHDLVADEGLDRPAPEMVDAGPAVAALDGTADSVFLYNVERDPEMGSLARQTLAELYPELGIDPAEVTAEEAYLFLTGGPSVTSAHVDHELNFLLVIRGHKRVFIADVPSPEAELALEALHSGRYGTCGSLPSAVTEYEIGPGEGVFIPPRGAHYVLNGDEPCAALSIVFNTAELQHQARIYSANARIRRLGLTPTTLGANPGRDSLKSAVVGFIRSAKSVGRRLPKSTSPTLDEPATGRASSGPVP